MATFRRLQHSVYEAETSCLLLEQSSIWLTSNSMPACAILALIALVTGPNSTRLCLVQFMPVTRANNAKLHSQPCYKYLFYCCSSRHLYTAAPYIHCRQWKAGQGLETRLQYKQAELSGNAVPKKLHITLTLKLTLYIYSSMWSGHTYARGIQVMMWICMRILWCDDAVVWESTYLHSC